MFAAERAERRRADQDEVVARWDAAVEALRARGGALPVLKVERIQYRRRWLIGRWVPEGSQEWLGHGWLVATYSTPSSSDDIWHSSYQHHLCVLDDGRVALRHDHSPAAGLWVRSVEPFPLNVGGLLFGGRSRDDATNRYLLTLLEGTAR